jgi:hypothetical protein
MDTTSYLWALALCSMGALCNVRQIPIITITIFKPGHSSSSSNNYHYRHRPQQQ